MIHTNHHTTITILLAALIFACSATLLSAQQSDYDIQRNFQQNLSELAAEVEGAEEVDELTQLQTRIDNLESEYSEHAELINAAIYPQTFQVLIGNLRDQINISLSNAEVVEELSSTIDGLNTEINEYQREIDALSQSSSDLQSRLQQAESNEQNQAALLQEYRQHIEQRNNFVSQFLEQLLTRYQDITPSDQREITEASGRLEDNPLTMLDSILAEYIRIAGEPVGLGAPDYISMRAQHSYFADVWNRVGDGLADTFAGDNASQAKAEIDSQLAGWIQTIDTQLWNTFAEAFENNGIELEEFSNENEFYNALYSYVENARLASAETNSEEDYNVYSNFNDYWNNTVKAEWGSLLINAEILDQGQIAAIDMQLAEWSNAAAPESNMMLILLIISIVIIIGLVVLLMIKRK